VLEALRLAVYQLLFLSRVPPYAAVDHAVNTVRQHRGAKVAGFVNAVLRRIDRADLDRGLPEEESARLGLVASLPDELVTGWEKELDRAQLGRLCHALLLPPPLTIRLNVGRRSAEEISAGLAQEGASLARCPLAPLAYKLSDLVAPFQAASYLRGDWTAQDEAAQLAVLGLGVEPGEVVIDACAGLGGKATYLAQLVGPSGRVVAVDPNGKKLELLAEAGRRLGLTCQMVEGDFMDLACSRAGDPADRVLVDAPCTALGVIRRHPEIKWRDPLGRQAQVVALQRRLMLAGVRALRPGGVLVYAVCTFMAAETTEQVQWLLEQVPSLRLQGLVGFPLADLAQRGFVTLWPHVHQTDGFFISRFQLH
jgi:16S rRNA (cytosine967-C5)-methyltransferase